MQVFGLAFLLQNLRKMNNINNKYNVIFIVFNNLFITLHLT